MKHKIIKGLELSEIFYREAVKPILDRAFPEIPYSAALLGAGSEVLGFDTAQSTDHDWGPRLMLFLSEGDHASYKEKIDQTLRWELPAEIHGYSTSFAPHADGTVGMRKVSETGNIHHRVLILTSRSFFQHVLHFDPMGKILPLDWVSTPEYHLLMLTAGRVFYDGLGQLKPLREKISYYPDDVWYYLLAGQWRRIGQEDAFVGRCGQIGDELGSRLVASRLVRDLMRLCFLMERKYAPYIKWFGHAFAQLYCARELAPVFDKVLAAVSWKERQACLSTAYEFVAEMHNALGITEQLPTKVSQFHNRPFLVIQAENFANALRAAIQSEEVLALPEYLGSFDQFVDSTDALKYLERIKKLY